MARSLHRLFKGRQILAVVNSMTIMFGKTARIHDKVGMPSVSLIIQNRRITLKVPTLVTLPPLFAAT